MDVLLSSSKRLYEGVYAEPVEFGTKLLRARKATPRRTPLLRNHLAAVVADAAYHSDTRSYSTESAKLIDYLDPAGPMVNVQDVVTGILQGHEPQAFHELQSGLNLYGLSDSTRQI